MPQKRTAVRVDEDIWSQAKAKAALERITLQEALERLLKGWIDGKIKIDKK